jgi:2-phosphoglycerate kinase
MTTARRADPLPLGGEDGLPFSKGRLARALMDAGVPTMRAYELALRVEDDLRRRGASSVQLERLEELAVEVLGEDEGRRGVGRLRRLGRLRALDIPIVVLLGGGTGTGKSTVATEVAHRLGITRVTSTDFIRQTMRAFFSPEFMPSVHYSSFEAGHALPAAEREAGDPLLLGFMDQTRHVLVGVQASIDRALEEGWSAVLEGVHLVPGMVSAPKARALVVHAVVAIEDENVHERHFTIRDAESGGIRPHDKYVDRLSDIRQIQEFIIEEARKESVPVIAMGNIDQAIGTVLELVLDRAEQLQEVAT